ncbi:MAG: hypothetical protein QXI89_01105 [Candidatus Anstonellales archaeon]
MTKERFENSYCRKVILTRGKAISMINEFFVGFDAPYKAWIFSKYKDLEKNADLESLRNFLATMEILKRQGKKSLYNYFLTGLYVAIPLAKHDKKIGSAFIETLENCMKCSANNNILGICIENLLENKNLDHSKNELAGIIKVACETLSFILEQQEGRRKNMLVLFYNILKNDEPKLLLQNIESINITAMRKLKSQFI